MKTQLEVLREKIDKIDQAIIDLLSQRIAIVKEVGDYKRKKGLPILDKDRFQKAVAARIEWGKKLGMPKKFIASLYKLVHDHAVEVEK